MVRAPRLPLAGARARAHGRGARAAGWDDALRAREAPPGVPEMRRGALDLSMRNRCPRCGRTAIRRIKGKELDPSTHLEARWYWICNACGYEHPNSQGPLLTGKGARVLAAMVAAILIPFACLKLLVPDAKSPRPCVGEECNVGSRSSYGDFSKRWEKQRAAEKAAEEAIRKLCMGESKTQDEMDFCITKHRALYGD